MDLYLVVNVVNVDLSLLAGHLCPVGTSFLHACLASLAALLLLFCKVELVGCTLSCKGSAESYFKFDLKLLSCNELC